MCFFPPEKPYMPAGRWCPGLCVPACPLDFTYCFTHPRFSCSNTPLLLLLISPSGLTLSNLYFRNTSHKCCNWCFIVTGPETIFKHVPKFLMRYWIFSPIHPLHIYISKKHHPLRKYFNIPPPRANIAGEAHPLYSGPTENEQTSKELCVVGGKE